MNITSDKQSAAAEPPSISDTPAFSGGPLVLLLLDGWGVAPVSEANAIASAKTPFLDDLINEYPVAVLSSYSQTLNARYLSLGTGCDLRDEEVSPLNSLAAVLAASNKKQLKITETERLAALTHFFNGRREERFYGEEWKIVSSVAGEKKPAFATVIDSLLKELAKALKEGTADFIVVSCPSIDLAAAHGDYGDIVKVVETIDKSLKKAVSLVAEKMGTLIISSAEGNAENARSLVTELPDKEMTMNPVPFLLIGERFRGLTIGLSEPLNGDLSLLAPAGSLRDVAPTILDIMGIEPPASMSGRSLLRHEEGQGKK